MLPQSESVAQEVKSSPCIETMTTTERDAMSGVAEGTMIFNTSTGCLNLYQGDKWRIFCENNRKEEVKYDQKTGKLDYKVGDEWLSFSMVKDEIPEKEDSDQLEKNHELPVDVEDSKSAAYLPIDCRQKPTRPYAGKDLVGVDTVLLQGNRPSHGIGFWQIIKGEGGKIIDSLRPNTAFIGIQETTYHLRWTIATQCDTLFDEMGVRFRPPCDPKPSQSFAGNDQFNVEETKLNANYPRVGKGSWTIISGNGGILGNHEDPKSHFTGKAGESYLIRWVIRNECGLTFDDVIISIKPPCSPRPSQANAGDDQVEVEKCRLNAEVPKHGTGKWRILEGDKGKFFNKESPTTTFYGQPGETYVLQWTVSTKCGSTADEVTVQFASYCPDEFTDFRDGKKYKSTRLAGLCWMTENLDYQGEDIEWYCYEGYPDNCEKFGALYSWNTAMAGKSKEKVQGICPEGWHIPSDKEWQYLIDSSGYSGIELQLNGNSGFDVGMGGARYTNGKYLNKREYAYFWSSTSKDEITAWNRYFPFKSNNIDHFPTDKNHSFSIRCVKDD